MENAPCQFCKDPSANSCANCLKVFYCSKEHQKLDWSDHRRNCFPGIIEWSHVVGRHLISSRPIREGEIILKETPIASGPSGKSGHHPICLACYRIVHKEDETCKNCHWPIHSRCQNDPIHFGHECKVFSQNCMPPFNRREVHMYEKVMLLRCLLQKITNPSNWAKIRDLESHHQARHLTHKGKLLSTSAIDFIHQVCRLEEFKADEIDHVLGVLSTNAFVTEDTLSTSPLFRSGSYLFYHGSFPAHDCLPNTKWTIDIKSKYTLRALRDISKGEPITQLYTESIVGTLQRRQHLKDSKYFLCSCARCADSTENESYFSAIKCLNCAGNLLPLDPLNENSSWNCRHLTSQCQEVKTVQGIETFLTRIRKEYKLLTNQNSIEAIIQLEKMREKYLTYLHTHHFLIHEIEQDILQRSSYLILRTSSDSNQKTMEGGHVPKKKRLDMASRMVELSRKSLFLLDKISPGQTTHRGRQMYFLQQGLCEIISEQIPKCLKQKTNTPQLQIEIAEVIKLREVGAIILSSEAEAREEFILAKKMADNSSSKMTRIYATYNKLQK